MPILVEGWPALLLGLLLMLGAAPATAAADVPISATGLIGYADISFAAADGERSWLAGGFGKGRYGGGADGDWRVTPALAAAGAVWQPHLGWSLDATVSAIAQRGQQHAVDLSEAFLTFRPLPVGRVKLTARAGLFWPPVSLEHGGPEWAVTSTVTPSAINSWIGEEVKLAGLEGSATTMIGQHRLTATGALFGLNQTAGTLLAFRGWALHDEQATAFGLQPLPPLNAFMAGGVQAARTRPVLQIDHRPGWYVKLAWAPPGPVELHYVHYDNRSDPLAVTSTLQWGWRTRFDHVGAVLDLGQRTRLVAQGMTGETVMGYARDGRPWVYTRFRSAFLLGTRAVGRGSVSARVEGFDTRNHGSEVTEEDDETGWAATVAGKLPVHRNVTLLAELLHIDSRREARLREGVAPRQRQTIAQLSLRFRAAR